MRYKFSLAPKIKGYVEWQLEHYHEDKRQMEEYKRDMMPSGIAKYGDTGGGSSGPGNPTAATVERMATNPYIFTTERNVGAVERALTACDEETRRLIDLIYWRRTHTVTGAGYKIGMSPATAYRKVNHILCYLSIEMGLVNP